MKLRTGMSHLLLLYGALVFALLMGCSGGDQQVEEEIEADEASEQGEMTDDEAMAEMDDEYTDQEEEINDEIEEVSSDDLIATDDESEEASLDAIERAEAMDPSEAIDEIADETQESVEDEVEEMEEQAEEELAETSEAMEEEVADQITSDELEQAESEVEPEAEAQEEVAAESYDEPVQTSSGGGSEYVTRKGDSLGNIAHMIYGDSNRWRELASSSSINDPNKIFPGDVISYDVNQSSEKFHSAYSNTSMKSVTVQKGDSLFKIARRVLGDGSAWNYLYQLNKDKISNPDLIQAGMTLQYIGSDQVNSYARVNLDGSQGSH